MGTYPFNPGSGSGFANPMTTLGDLIYENATPAPARLAGNTTATRKFLRQTGTGSVSAAPAWDTLQAGDLPAVPSSLIGLAPSGDTTGATDFTNIQGLLTLTGWALLQAGLFYVNNMLQVSSDSCLQGAGKGITTIRMASGSWSGVAQVGSINGVGAIITHGNTTASYIAVRDLTVDGNQTGITVLPSWATSGSAAGDNVTNSPLHLNDVTNLLIENVEVINSIGYGLYSQLCAQFTIQNCRVLTGQVSASQGWGLPSQQDGIHLDGCSLGLITGCNLDTGTFTTDVGDDAIALQSLSGTVHDITISGNSIRAGEAGVDLALSGNDIYDISIAGNNIWTTQGNGIVSQPFSGAGAFSRNISITGNTLTGTCGSATGILAAIGFYDYSEIVGTAAAAWEGVSIVGNVIENVTYSSAYGIYARYGTDITIIGNTIRNFQGLEGIYIGDNIAATSLPVTQYTVMSNTVDMSASTAAGCGGVILYDSTTGAISGNTIIGPGGNSTDRIGVCPDQASAVNLARHINITNNTMSGWDFGIQEFNAGGGNPDFNAYSGNLFTNCTTNLSILGTHSQIIDATENILLGPVTLPAGTSSAAPLTFLSGTSLTSAAAGAAEFDGVAAYFTNETTSGRGLIPVEQKFRLTSTGSTISTIANFFGSTSNISLVSGAEYEIEIDCWFLKTTAGTVTWTFTNSAAPTSMTLDYQLSPATGIVSTAAATDLFGQQYNITATAPTVVSGSLTSAVNHRHKFWIRLINGTGTSLKIQATASAGTITPGINSYWKARRVPAANVGTFSA